MHSLYLMLHGLQVLAHQLSQGSDTLTAKFCNATHMQQPYRPKKYAAIIGHSSGMLAILHNDQNTCHCWKCNDRRDFFETGCSSMAKILSILSSDLCMQQMANDKVRLKLQPDDSIAPATPEKLPFASHTASAFGNLLWARIPTGWLS